MSVRLLLADDHTLVRQGLRALLEREQFEVLAEAADGFEAVQAAEKLNPDVAILDLGMPGLNGIDASREIRRASPRSRVVLLTMHPDEHYVLAALRSGVRGYVLKTRAAADLVQAIREVCAGHMYLSPGIAHAVVEAFLSKNDTPEDPLTRRERQVLQLVAEGKTTKETAVILGISAKTVESHRTRLMQKLDIHETAGLVRYAIRSGVIQA
ncbi:MAG TPA: response regulator transcription factor [Haliangiales bacterium]|nr:response regulator transcription factor [Haliangiales bacterium]